MEHQRDKLERPNTNFLVLGNLFDNRTFIFTQKALHCDPEWQYIFCVFSISSKLNYRYTSVTIWVTETKINIETCMSYSFWDAVLLHIDPICSYIGICVFFDACCQLMKYFILTEQIHLVSSSRTNNMNALSYIKKGNNTYYYWDRYFQIKFSLYETFYVA